MPWTEVMIDALRQYHGKKSYAEIAKIINLDLKPHPLLTRNAVCGKVSRLGLPPHQAPFAAVNAVRAKIRRERDAQRVEKNAQIEAERDEKEAQKRIRPRREIVPGITKDEAAAYDEQAKRVPPASWDGVSCAWPIGDPKEPEFGYCAAERAQGAYCEHHARRRRGDTARPVSAPKEA